MTDPYETAKKISEHRDYYQAIDPRVMVRDVNGRVAEGSIRYTMTRGKGSRLPHKWLVDTDDGATHEVIYQTDAEIAHLLMGVAMTEVEHIAIIQS